LTPLNVLYVVLAVAVLAIATLLVVVLWQVSLLIAQVRTALLPEVRAALHEVEQNLTNVDRITDDVQHKLGKLDKALNAANDAVQSIGDTTVLVNRTVAQPVVIQVASLVAGVRGAVRYLAERNARRITPSVVMSRTEAEAQAPIKR